MLNLAECYEKTGRTASAWAEYREAIPLARAAGSKARLVLATERAQALQERLSTLTIRAITCEDSDPHFEMRRDGVRMQPAELVACRHGTNEDALVLGIGPQARAIAEQRPA